MVPPALLDVRARLQLAAGAVGTGRACADHAEPSVQQSIESLLDERMFEEVTSRVAVGVGGTAVWVTTIIESTAEHLPTLRRHRGLGHDYH